MKQDKLKITVRIAQFSLFRHVYLHQFVYIEGTYLSFGGVDVIFCQNLAKSTKKDLFEITIGTIFHCSENVNLKD
jgi:hypothetical protein